MHRIVNIIAYDDNVSDEDKEIAEKAGIKITTFNEIVAKGKEFLTTNPTLPEVTKEDVFLLSYTSGTTGDPKGV